MTEKRSTDPAPVVVRRGVSPMLVGAVLLCALIAMLVGGIRLQGAIDDIERAEKRDIDATRQQTFRQCERSNFTRAEIQVQFAMPAVPSKELAKYKATEPLLVGLLTASAAQQKAAKNRVGKYHAILLCAPNLTGGGAKQLTRKDARRFLDRYVGLELDPLPVRPPR